MTEHRPSVIKHRRTTLERAEKFITDENSTVNLRSRLYPSKTSISHMEHYAALDRISYDEAMKGSFEPCQVGESFGPVWSTHWFRLSINIPAAWLGKEVGLRWNSGSESMIWKNGKTVQAFSSTNDRTDYCISKCLVEKEFDQQFYIEMACSGLFGAGKNGLIQPPDKKKEYCLKMAELVVRDGLVKELLIDMEILVDIVKSLKETNRSYQALYTLNDMVNLYLNPDRENYQKALEISREFLEMKNGDSQMTLHAMGHCHIDTAWLWPYAETKRKCARSWTNVCRLMEEFPDFTFVCSQAQQYAWVKENYPSLFEEIKQWVKEGRFIPSGGVWVEMDGNIPSGESFIRQFLYGQRFYKSEFGIECNELWLPDTFGYSAQLPQILNHVGINRFLTQKMSWNLVNKFPHHTFFWSGIDGSEVLVHFPPADNYCSSVTAEEFVKVSENFREKGRSQHAALVYGHGDGGQGPTEEMILRIDKLKDCDGLPKVVPSSPDEFFAKLEEEDDNQYCKWVGELYLELHNGTYTTQAEIKKENRACEFLLQGAEFWQALAGGSREDLVQAWKILLLNQFHDVLPGSCIRDVVKDALAYYKTVHDICDSSMNQSLKTLFRGSDVEAVVLNTTSFPRRDVITYDDQEPICNEDRSKRLRKNSSEVDGYGRRLALVEVPSCGYKTLDLAICDPKIPVEFKKCDEFITIENGLVKAVLDLFGRLTGFYAKTHEGRLSKNLFSEEQPGNEFVIFYDVPLFWDAWDVMDYHLETRQPIHNQGLPIHTAHVVDQTSLRVSVEISLKISDCSYLKQTIILDADSPILKFQTEVEWREKHKFLKVEFPAKIVAEKATYEIQFGHLSRPTHYNTSWDQAKFEVCGHKWMNLSQYDLGISVLNDSKYGMSCRDNVMRLSLLRAPKAPDQKADMGCHSFTYALLPHFGTYQSSDVIKHAYCLNVPLQLRHLSVTSSKEKCYFSLDTEAVVLETVKTCEDDADALVVRLYESFGSDCRCVLTTEVNVRDVRLANGMEEVWEDEPVLFHQGEIHLSFRPFEVKTVMISVNR